MRWQSGRVDQIHSDVAEMQICDCAIDIAEHIAHKYGSTVQQFAQSWLVYDLTKDPFYLGLDLFLGQLPIIMFSLFGGVFADRLDRRKILLTSQYIQMASAAALTVLVAMGVVQIWEILCLSFVSGFAQAFGGPAYSALIPTLVDREDMPNAIALNSIQFNLAVTVGPALAGNPQGSPQYAIDSSTGAPSGRQRYLPYGALNGARTIKVTDRAFHGQPLDDSTGLIADGPATTTRLPACFISPDPILSSGTPASAATWRALPIFTWV